jgi:hypothetical protein
MAILSDWELWACANTAIEQHGTEALATCRERADALLEVGDRDGVKNWLLIGERIEQLMITPAGRLH